MKNFTLLLLLTSLYLGAFSQTDTLIWTSAGTYPDISVPAIYNDAVVFGDTLYAKINNAGSAAATFEKYYIDDPSMGGGAWEAGTPLPATILGGHMVECGGLIYYMGGGSSVSTPGDAVYSYDPTTGVWTTRASMPVALSGHSAVAWGDSVIFLMGGPWSTTPTSNLDVYYYRPATDTWGTNTGASGLPSGGGRRAFGCAIDGNKIIIAAGFASAFLQTAFVGTIGTDATDITWEQIADVPGIYGLSRCGGTAVDGNFFLVGGERSSSGGYSDITHVYNFDDNIWNYSFPAKPLACSNIFGSVASTQLTGDTVLIFTVGGYNSGYYANFDVAKFFSYPIPVITPPGPINLCDGESVTLTSSLADTYLWSPGGETTQSIDVIASGEYTVTVTNSDPMNGVGVSLSVIVDVTIIDVSVNITGGSLEANASGMDSYQWLDCDDNMSIIPGETNQTFTPDAPGSYAVIIGYNSCIDTSECVTFTDIKEIEIQNLSVYPNPAEDLITIQTTIPNIQDYIEIYNMFGQLMDVIKFNKSAELNINNYASGVYALRFREYGYVIQFIKQ